MYQSIRPSLHEEGFRLKGSHRMKQNRLSSRFRRALPSVSATICAVFMLCIVPLLYHDAFFDINRVKVNAVVRAVPVFSAVSMIAVVFSSSERKSSMSVRSVQVIACLLAVSCIVSCALTGFEEAVITGNEGRYCGLQFVLCCIAAFFVIGSARTSFSVLIPVLLVTSSVCAALGVVNAMGVDPLGFYAHIKKGQEQMFLSTIGHFDFFGTFLVMMFPIAGAQFIFEKRRIAQTVGIVSSFIIALGAVVSRTDSAFFGLHMACFMLLALSGGNLVSLGKALILWGISFSALPIVYTALKYSPFKPGVSGLPKLLYQIHAGEFAAILLLIAGIYFVFQQCKTSNAPGHKRFFRLMITLFCVFVFVCLCAVFYFSAIDTKTPLGIASAFLRFNDHWGSLRGFVYMRALRAYADFDLTHKLFGGGLDLALRLLTPYFDNPAMLQHGVFNDVHCQPLQMLLTCGIFGCISFLALYFFVMKSLLTHADEDPILCGILSSLFSYGLIMLINVTQPILILTYLSVSALGISRLRWDRNTREASR